MKDQTVEGAFGYLHQVMKRRTKLARRGFFGRDLGGAARITRERKMKFNLSAAAKARGSSGSNRNPAKIEQACRKAELEGCFWWDPQPAFSKLEESFFFSFQFFLLPRAELAESSDDFELDEKKKKMIQTCRRANRSTNQPTNHPTCHRSHHRLH